MTAARWPFDPDTPHTDVWPCMCTDCRDKRAAGMKKAMRASRRDMARWMVDPQHLKDRA